MFVPDRTRRVVVSSRGRVEVQNFAEMQGQCTRCRRPWGGHGKGRRAAAGVGSSYLVRRDLSTSGLHSQPFAALAGLLALAGTTATGRALEHWLDGGGILGPSKRESANKGRLAARGGLCLGALYSLRCARQPVIEQPFNLCGL
jgi:hypothetical protein